MPELSRFYNIIIKMIFNDNSQHHKPHFHVYFAEYEASVGIDGELLAGTSRETITPCTGMGNDSRRRIICRME